MSALASQWGNYGFRPKGKAKTVDLPKSLEARLEDHDIPPDHDIIWD
jgi:hypothetical protein